MPKLEFTQSRPLSMGVELELQILNTRDYNLSRGADDMLKLAHRLITGEDEKEQRQSFCLL